MVKSVLPAPAEKRARVEAMFDRISPRYDRMNRLMTLGIDRSWRRRAVATLALAPGDRLLDLACGTGDLALEGLRAGARVVGVDVSSGMLRQARRRGVSCPLVRADASSLPLADASFSAVVSGFALRNFTDVGRVLAEAARVLVPGGRLALLEVDVPRRACLRFGHRFYFERVVPLLGRWLADAEAYSYLPSSVVFLPSEAELRIQLAARGFEAVTKRSLLGGAAQLVTARRRAATGAGDV